MFSFEKRGMVRFREAGILALSGLLLAQPAFAQEAATGVAEEDSGEIIVTAQKREQNLQDVGVAVSALGENALASIGRQDVTALAGQAPSLQVNQYSPTITVFNIRGVSQNDFADSQEAPIAFYNDEVYIGALGAISGQTFDLQRVEILRGPQGTLFGRNATGGLVQVISAKPSDKFEGFATLTGGSYSQFATEAAVSGPLSDHVRARLSVTSDRHGGYIRNRVGPDRGGSRFYGGRLQVETDIGDGGKLLLKLQGLRNNDERSSGLYSHVATGFDADGLGFALAPDQDFWGTGPGNDATGYRDADNDPFRESIDRDGRFDRKFWSITARYDQKLGDVDFVSITDYQKLKKTYGEDSDVSPNPVFNYDTGQDLYQFSQEFRLSGDTDRLHWLVGLYGLKIRSDNSYQVDLSQSLGLLNNYGGRQTTDSLAVFGQLEYRLSDQVSVIGGARYSADKKRLNFRHDSTDVASGTVSTFLFNTTTDPNLAREKFNDFSGKLELDFRPADKTLIYLSVNRGTKSGGFGVQAFQPIDPATLPFDREILTSYEGGFKLTLADRKVNFNGSAFYYDYKDYQAFSIVGVSQFISNHPATVKGFELELFARPVHGLTLQTFLAYLDTKVEGIALPLGRVTDRKLPQAPSWSLGGMVRYEFGIGSGTLALQSDLKYNSSQFFSTFNAPIDREPGYVSGNARISYTLDSKGLEFAAFVNNLTDKKYRIYNLDLSTALGLANQTFARPRWFGGSVSYHF